MELLAAFVIFGTIFFLLLAFGGGDSGQVRSRLDALGGQPAVVESSDPARPSVMQRIISPVTRAPVEQLHKAMPKTMLQNIEKRLLVAGEPMTLHAFLTFQLVSAAAFFGMPVLVVFGGMVAVSPMSLGVILALGGVGVFVPHFWLRSRVSQRQNLIIKSLPDSFDLITTCVEAGLGLDAALSRVADKVEGPFAEELSRALREISLGKERVDALRELGERTGVPDLIQFVNAVIQAERMGSSVGVVLRVQADQLRVRRRQRAEEQAYKAPVKMIFPLVLCIFPTLFIVILGPAAITIMQDFPSGG